MNILITGAAGFIGSSLANYLYKNNLVNKIILVDNLSGGYISNLCQELHNNLYIADLIIDDISYLFREHKIDYVINCAADAREILSPFIRKQSYQSNIIASANLINNCIEYDIKKIIHFSSIGVYGHGKSGQEFTENDIPNPADPYSIGKYAIEIDLAVAASQHNLNYTILRPFNVYGPNQCLDDIFRNVIAIWIRQILNDQSITIYGSGNQTRCFTYINDILEPITKCLTQSNTDKEIINLGGLRKYTINEAADTLIRAIGKGEKKYLEPRYESDYSVSLCTKAQELLGLAHNTSLEQGIKNMYEWALTQPKRGLLKLPEYEINKGIYSYWKK